MIALKTLSSGENEGGRIGGKDQREQTSLVWPCGKTGRQLCRPESPNTANWKKKERPPKEEVERLHLGRPPHSWRAARGRPGQSEVERGNPLAASIYNHQKFLRIELLRIEW